MGYLLNEYCERYDGYKVARQYADDSKAFKFLADELFTRANEIENILKECFNVNAFEYWLSSRDI